MYDYFHYIFVTQFEKNIEKKLENPIFLDKLKEFKVNVNLLKTFFADIFIKEE